MKEDSEEIRKRLDSYFEVTVRSVRDSVPKAIGFYLVRAVQAARSCILKGFWWAAGRSRAV